jgi:hypothetical protein
MSLAMARKSVGLVILLLVSIISTANAGDSDLDGIDDSLDICPYASGNASQAEAFGCPDSDGDGWADFQNATAGAWADSTQDYYVSIGSTVNAVAWHPDGMSYVAGGNNNMVEKFNVRGQSLSLLLAGPNDVNDLHFSPDGSKLAVAMDNGLMSVIDPNNGNNIYNLTISSQYDIYCVQFSHDGSKLYVGTQNYTLHEINTINWTQTNSEVFGYGVYDISLTPDDSQVLIATGYHVALLWANNLSTKENFTGFNDITATVDIDATGRYFGVGSYNNWAYIYDLRNYTEVFSSYIGRNVRDVEFTPDSTVMLVASENTQADAILLSNMTHAGTFGSFGSSNQNRGTRDLAIHPDGGMALVGMRRGRVSMHVIEEGYLLVEGGDLTYLSKQTWRNNWPTDGRLLNTKNMTRDFATIDICSGSGAMMAGVDGPSHTYTTELANHSESGLLDCLTSSRQIVEVPIGRYPAALVIKAGGDVDTCLSGMGGLSTAQIRWMLSASARNKLASNIGELPGMDLSSVAPNSDLDGLREWSDLSANCPDNEIVFVSLWENKTDVPMLVDALFCGNCAEKDSLYSHSNDRARISLEWRGEIRTGVTGPSGDSSIGMLELQYVLDDSTGMTIIPILDNLTHGIEDANAAGGSIITPSYNNSRDDIWPLQSDFRLMVANEDLEDKRDFIEWYLGPTGQFTWESEGFIALNLWDQVVSWGIMGVDNKWMLPDADSDGVWDGDDDCPDTIDGSIVDLKGCAEVQLDDDNDGINNAIDDCDNEEGNASISPFVGCLDQDGDGYADVDDTFEEEPSQWRDSDSDGYGDELQGFEGDSCVNETGNSTIDRFGCPDIDGDGYSDENDAFPNNDSQWSDVDEDGYGDNYNFTGSSDSRINETGDAFIDLNSQWRDRDGDGFGDNNSGVNGDDCPDIPGTSIRNETYGCIDTDSDGYADSIDDLPNETTQWWDKDGDGYGDNIAGQKADYCPQTNPNETDDVDADGCGVSERDTDFDGVNDAFDDCPNTSPFKVTQVDETGCAPYEKDSDGDGVSDEDDWAPFDATQSQDSDGDGIGDNNQVEGGDDCPQQAGNSTRDRVGCIDTDGDGIPDPYSGWKVEDGADWKPQDATQWVDSDGDGYGDNWGNETWNLTRNSTWPGEFIVGATKADRCPVTSYVFANSNGCPPGTIEEEEEEPQSKSEETSSGGMSTLMISVVAVGSLVVLALLGAILVILKKPKQAHIPEEGEDPIPEEAEDSVIENSEPLTHVPTWEGLPSGGDYLPKDEHGTNWYKGGDGSNWYQNSDGSWSKWQ